MKKFPRRSFLATLGSLPVLLSFGWAKKAEALTTNFISNSTSGKSNPFNIFATTKTALEISKSKKFKPGYLSMIQGPTSDEEALFNIFAPRLKKYTYEVRNSSGGACTVSKYSTVTGPGFYNVDKVKVTGLKLGEKYTLKVQDGSTTVDERIFYALDVNKTTPNFALLSCMADDYRFDEIINPMWDRLRNEKPDFIILNGDAVYVDSFEFVERQKATEFDLWQRYTDSCKRIPLYHWETLVPVFTTWDDHDYGTNDGDQTFAVKNEAGKLFRAFYCGDEIKGVWAQGPHGVSSSLTAFGQRFFFMDDRTFRTPNKASNATTEPYGHWGMDQHEWLIKNIETSKEPAWIINGNQVFSGVALGYKQNLADNHPKEFTTLIDQLSKIKAPVVFASGDIHFSEVQSIPKRVMGYDTYEFTSSSMHSYTGTGWTNPARVSGTSCIEFNFLLFQSKNDNGALKVDVKCLGLEAAPYFTKSFTVQV